MTIDDHSDSLEEEDFDGLAEIFYERIENQTKQYSRSALRAAFEECRRIVRENTDCEPLTSQEISALRDFFHDTKPQRLLELTSYFLEERERTMEAARIIKERLRELSVDGEEGDDESDIL